MKAAMVWFVVVSFVTALFVSPLQADTNADVHPLKAWVQENKAERKSVDETKARSQARRNAWKGALIGGLAAGARAALLRQDVARAMVAGAAAGAVAGFLIGRMQDRQLADRSQLEERVAYEASQGYRAQITRMECDPCRVKPGDKFNVTVSYWVIGPERSALSFSRHLGLSVDGTYVRVFTFDPDPFTLEQGGGEFETTLEYTIPKEGTYTMEWLVENDQTSLQQVGSTNIVVTSEV